LPTYPTLPTRSTVQTGGCSLKSSQQAMSGRVVRVAELSTGWLVPWLVSPEPVLGTGLPAGALVGAVVTSLLVVLLIWGMPHLLSSSNEPSYPTEPVWLPSDVQPSSPVASPTVPSTTDDRSPPLTTDRSSMVVKDVDVALSSRKASPARKRRSSTPSKQSSGAAGSKTPRTPTPSKNQKKRLSLSDLMLISEVDKVLSAKKIRESPAAPARKPVTKKPAVAKRAAAKRAASPVASKPHRKASPAMTRAGRRR
jgi:hypothetical protein